MNKLQWLFAQRGNSKSKEFASSLMIRPEELPGPNWIVQKERRWRTGATGVPSNEVLDRAHDDGTFTIWTIFGTIDGQKNVWIELIPLRSEEDAKWLVPRFRSVLQSNPEAAQNQISESTVDESFVPYRGEAWCWESLTEDSKGTVIQRVLGGRVENIAFVVACSTYGDTSSWEEVATIATTVNANIHSKLGEIQQE
jgi:hypothetical protein